MTDWAHLPNAAHIDRVFASVKAHRNQWAEAWNTVQAAVRGKARPSALDVVWSKAWSKVQDAGRTAEYNAAWIAERDAAWAVVRDAERDAAWAVARDASCNSVQDATRCALLALCVYDDCAYMLDSDPGELAILAAFGDHRAVLLLPACKVFHSSKEIT